jgi:hypothetical protein
MRTWQKVFVAAGPVFILGLQAVYTVLLATPSASGWITRFPDAACRGACP